MRSSKNMFRIWDKKYNKMIYPDFITNEGKVGDFLSNGEQPYFYPKDRIIIMFNLGFKDLNGKIVYEKDILLIDRNFHPKNKELWDKEFIEDIAHFYECKGYQEEEMEEEWDSESIEVIGNKFENPELKE